VRFRVLGPLEVWDAGLQRRLGRGRDRALLALLLLRRNEVLSVDEILDALSGTHPRAEVEPEVASSISRLRDTLGPDALVAQHWGYGLRAPARCVDADEFAGLVDRARHEDPTVAAETLREALALWRGPAFADVAEEPFLHDEIARLELARRAAEKEAFELSTHGRRLVDEPAPELQTEAPADESLSTRLRRTWSFAAHEPRRLAAAGAAVVVAATIALIWGNTRESRHVVAGPNMVAALDPKMHRVVDAFRVGSVPTQLAVGGNAVWVLNANDHTVSRIDTSTRLVRTVPVGGDATGLAAVPGSGWVSNGWRGTVSRIDPRSKDVLRTVRVPGRRYTRAIFIAATRSEVWAGGFTLPANAPSPFGPPPKRPVLHLPPAQFLAWRIDPRTNTVVRTVSLEGISPNSRSVLLHGNALWVRDDDSLVRLDRRTGRIEHRLALPSNGCCEWGGVAIGAGSIWVPGIARGVLWRIDSRGGAIAATIPLRGHPSGRAVGEPAGVAVGAGFVWVADATGGVLMIDPKTNDVLERIPIAGVPHGVAFGLGRVWVSLA
jgi:DNA-binding beta-propeller fold protein YncE